MSQHSHSSSVKSKDWVSPHAPLGMRDSHDHYIRPIPPIYVSEYESAYTWPNIPGYSKDPNVSKQGSHLRSYITSSITILAVENF